MQGFKTMCEVCIHLDPDSGLRTCTAFPDGIPDEIILGDEFHVEPHEGDGGIVFQPKPGVDPNELRFSRIIDEED
jgi:hypothetical protein